MLRQDGRTSLIQVNGRFCHLDWPPCIFNLINQTVIFQPSGSGPTNPFLVNSEDTYNVNVNSLDSGYDTFASSGPAPSGAGGSGAPATNYYGAAPATSHFATSPGFGNSHNAWISTGPGINAY